MQNGEQEKIVTFQSIRPAKCRCTTDEVCRECKGKRRDTPWSEAVRKNNNEKGATE